MGPRSRPRRHVVFLPFFLVPSTLALSLASFQTINTNNANCLAAYTADIPSCSNSDFTNGAPCSAGCVASLGNVQSEVSASCQGVQGPANSLLGDLLSGNMLVALCPNVQTTVTLVGTQTVSNPSSTSTSTVTPPSASPTSSSSSSTTSSSPPTSTTSTSLSSPSTTSSTSSFATTTTAPSFSSFTSLPANFQSTSSTALSNKPTTTPVQGGGGDPFEANTSNADTLDLSRWTLFQAAAGLGVAIIFACL